VERINPYAVMRNTATLEAYRAYNRAAMKAGAPFFVMGAILLPVWTPLQALAERRFGLAHAMALPLFVALMIGPAVVCLLFTVIGVLRTLRFRREHPIPEEWRQVPRVSPTPAPGRRPRLP